jgi:hypothetical protein
MLLLSGPPLLPPLSSSLRPPSSVRWEKPPVDLRADTPGSDGHVGEQLVEFFAISDTQLQVTWRNGSLLVVPSDIACQFEDFGAEVLLVFFSA